jgi:glycosyltransferase involved in cell wall biosynthesis
MTAPAPVYLVIPQRALSGAEKRFMGMWLHLVRQGMSDLRLVTSAEAFEAACDNRELRQVRDHEGQTVLVRGPGKMRLLLAPVLFKLWMRDRRSVFHFVMQAPGPFELPYRRRTVFTIPDPHLDHYSRRGLTQLYLGAALAQRVDMLDPILFEQFRSAFFFKRRAFSLTPNSFVDLDAYRPAPFSEKTNTLTFVGRFHEEKQVRRLLETIPEVDRALRDAGIAQPAFRILGNGADDVVRRCEALAQTGIDVRASFEPNPQGVLERSKVFFSLQKSNNYPSKSLLEAMACGNVPVVTDVGTSQRIAPSDLARYVPRDFTAQDIARASLEILTMDQGEFSARVAAIREFLADHFSVASMARYYVGLYRGVTAQPC